MKPLFHLLTAPLRWIHALLSLLLGRIEWQPAPWQRWYGTGLRRRPALYAGLPLLLALLIGAGWWWQQRPVPVDPEALTVRIEPPRQTRYHEDPPRVDGLTLQFSASAAPIERVDGEAIGVSLQPPLEGSWLWLGDDRLRFQPETDWPVGVNFQVRIDVPVALAPDAKLTDRALEFVTEPFVAQMSGAEFYQDPLDPSLKRAAFEVNFSHPVDVLGFERAVNFSMADGARTRLPAPDRKISYDQRKLIAYVQTGPLSVPENGGRVTLSIDAKFGSSMGGRPVGEALEEWVELPSLYSVRVSQLTPMLIENERFEPEQILLIGFNDRLKDVDVAKALRVWLLPEMNEKDTRKRKPYPWSQHEISDELLAASTRLELTQLASEAPYSQHHSFRFQADPGRRLYIEVERGLRAFGGFLLGDAERRIQQVPDYPQLLRFVGEGAVLSLKGERRISIAARNVPGLALEVARVKPDQLQHLVQYNHGNFAEPALYQPNVDSLTERFEHRLALPAKPASETHYHGIDLGEYFGAERHGVFLLRLFQHEPNAPQDPDDRYPAESYGGESWDGASDARLVLLTDLGMVVKRELDGSRQVYVMSLSGGRPVLGATVTALARNGEALHSVLTDASGRATLPDLAGYKREKQAVLLSVSFGDDLSFLPLNDHGRKLQLSRFDIGGEVNARDPGTLKGWLFSDRGLYRPGDELHIGMIVRAADWAQDLSGVPVEFDLHDPRGTRVMRERLTLDASGFDSRSYQPAWTAPTGAWEASLYLIGEENRRTLLGSTTVQVRDFEPDRLRLRVAFDPARSEGWLKPEDLAADIAVENLFGTPAQDRRITASLRLDPAWPSFRSYPDYRFYDPQRAKEGYSEELSDTRSDADGKARIAIDLSPYDRATYQLRLLTQAFEAGGGRGVAAQAQVLVSSNPYLVGLKPESDLSWVKRDAKLRVHALALDPQAQPTAVEGLQAVLIERRYVSVLTKQDSGLYKYVSQLRQDERKRTPLAIGNDGHWLVLDTGQPGDFLLEIRNSADELLNSIGWQVAGQANLTRSLERNAELQLSLSKTDYAPGEEIEISIRAPYAGAGLITIERDKVYAHRWFRTDNTASVQQIIVPQGLEGNAYVHVQYLRDAASSEIFMSPLSYAVAPFTVDRSARRLSLKLETPTLVKPGQIARFALSSDAPAKAVVFAIDEGILQVARYKLGDPLEHFFAKRMLEVETAQILDLLLPEFSQLLALAAAPGGDGEGALAKHLNPFKRKGDKPAVYWSGLVALDGRREFEFSVPDSFNGSLKVMAVAVSPSQIGIAQGQTLARADFVLSPNAPLQVAPGDEFEVSVGVSNTLEGAPTGPLPIQVSLELPDALTLVSGASQELKLAPGDEGVVRFRLRAGDQLGAPAFSFIASAGQARAERKIDLSLRPAWVYRSGLQLGATTDALQIDELRALYPNYAKRELNTSLSPLIAVDGLSAWLADYPHMCTEQLLSQALPALVYASNPEIGRLHHGKDADPFRGALSVLRERRNGDGAIGLWRAGPDNQPFVSAWSALFLIEASERGQRVPDDLMGGLNGYLERLAGDRARTSLFEFRERALAVYLLTRQGRVTSNLLAGLREQIDKDLPTGYQHDSTALFLAASYQLLQQPKAARELIKGPIDWSLAKRDEKQWLGYQRYHDEGIARGWLVYLVARHFPEQRERLGVATIEQLLEPIRRNKHNTLSSALTVLALESWGSQATPKDLPKLWAIGPAPGLQRSAFGERSGLYFGGNFAADSSALRIEPAAATQAWYILRQAGFDRTPPQARQDGGLELLRDYLDDEGQPLTRFKVGQEATVRLRLRALKNDAVDDLAIVDLFPGGFELVMQQAPPAADSDPDSADGNVRTGLPRLAAPGTTLHAVHEELRDDRVVLYVSANRSVREYRYRIKATAIGRYQLPPAYAESMYVQELYAQGPSDGVVEVVE